VHCGYYLHYRITNHWKQLALEKDMSEEPNTESTELKKPGRPCKYTPETVTRLLRAVEAVLTLRQSCKAAGISETTLYEWRGEYPELEPRLEAARERAREDALRVIQEAGKKDWRAKEAWLRLSFQADYRRDTSINVTATANAQQAIVVTEEKRRELQERLKPTKRIGG
jgi:hypothetical protein